MHSSPLHLLHPQIGDAANALRYFARAVTAELRELQFISPAPRDEKDQPRTCRPSTDRLAQTDEQVATGLASRETRSHHTVPNQAAECAHDELVDDTSLSYEQCLDKLADSRRRWMISVRRYCCNADNNNSRGKSDDISSQRDDILGRDQSHSPLLSKPNDGDPHSSLPTQQTLILHAADFCQRCAEIVAVEFEYTAEGVLLAEINRAVCSSCGNNPHISDHAGRTHAPGKWAALFRAYGTLGVGEDGGWQNPAPLVRTVGLTAGVLRNVDCWERSPKRSNIEPQPRTLVLTGMHLLNPLMPRVE